MSRTLGGLLILTENHTLVPPGDLDGLVEMARAVQANTFVSGMAGHSAKMGRTRMALSMPPNTPLGMTANAVPETMYR